MKAFIYSSELSLQLEMASLAQEHPLWYIKLWIQQHFAVIAYIMPLSNIIIACQHFYYILSGIAVNELCGGSTFAQCRDRLQGSIEALETGDVQRALLHRWTLITIGHSLYKQVLFRLYLFWDVFPVLLRTRGGPTLVMSYTSTRDPDCQVIC